MYALGDSSYGATGNASRGVPYRFEDGGGDLSPPEDVISKVPLPLRHNESVVEVVAGSFHSLARTSEGRVLGWGDNTHGQLGASRKGGFVYSLMQEAGSRQLAREEIEREVGEASRVEELPLPLQPGEGVSAVRTHAFHSSAVTDRGRLLLWGDNSYGQCGAEPANQSAVGDSELSVPLGPAQGFFCASATLGEYHTLALGNGSELYSFGINDRQQLGRMRGADWDAYPMQASAAWSVLAMQHVALQTHTVCDHRVAA